MEIPSAETSGWSLAEVIIQEGNLSLLRYRPDLEPFLGILRYAQRLVIIWKYESNDTSGMPTNQLSEDMGIFEDAILGELDPDRAAILAFVLTNFGCREWHFYGNDIQETGNRINSALSHLPKHPIHLQVEDDPNWDELRAVYNICNSLKGH